MVRPTQQSSTKRKRKSNDLIWARDGDHKNAQEHPCYLLENHCNEEETSKNDNDKVRVEWSSNGTIACIPKSRISTTVLSSRRSRRTNNNDGTRRSSDNNEQPTTNNNTKQNVNNDVDADRFSDMSREQARAEAIADYRALGGRGSPPDDWSDVNNSEDTDEEERNGQSESNNDSNTASLNEDKDSESDDEGVPDQILVEGCGIPEMNGTYHLDCNDEDGENVERVYIKSGEWKGEVEDFLIYRSLDSHDKHTHWYIGIYCGGYIPSARFYKAANNTEQPPVNGWTKVDHGVDPAPTLKYVYKTTDNNIASSVSDSSIKVKKKNITKVKEEEYGGETDNEEDMKIAAVPTPVVSSQLKKEEYEDTDDDVAPDPVQSSQLKVKEEEEDTDEEGTAPDQVQSTRVKEETGGDTDTDEDIASDPVHSAKVKEELGGDTDDEGIAPDQVKSVQVKEEVGEDTDIEDGKIVATPSLKREVGDDEDTDDGGSEADEESLDSSSRELLNSLVEFDSDHSQSQQETVVGHKLNLERGVIDHEHIKCTGLSDWDDMEDRQTTATEFVWWVGHDKFYCLPKNVYEFWARLYACKTWGDIRSSFTRGFYDMLMEMCIRAPDMERKIERKIKGKRFVDEMKFNTESLHPTDSSDLDMADNFPPYIEMIQYGAFMWHCRELMETFKTGYKDGWVLCFRGEERLNFEASEKSKVLEAISKYGGKAQYEPGLSEFYTLYDPACC